MAAGQQSDRPAGQRHRACLIIGHRRRRRQQRRSGRCRRRSRPAGQYHNKGPAGPSGGTFNLTGSQSLELFGASLAGVTFAAGATGTLKLDASGQFQGTVAGLALGNAIDFADIGFVAGTTPGYTPNSGGTGGVLNVGDGPHVASISLLGSYMASSFVASDDGTGHLLITDPPPGSSNPLVPAHG